jgi:hypothetical protein
MFIPTYEESNEMVLTQCGRHVVARQEGPLKAVDSLIGPGSRTSHVG